MALKSKIDAAAYAALPDLIKAEYKLVGADYLLDTDEAAELRAAHERSKTEATDAKAELKRINDKALEDKRLADEALAAEHLKNKDVTALDLSWNTKHTTALAAKDAIIAAKDKQIEELLVDEKAVLLAAEISTSPKLMLPHLRARMKADLTGEKPVLRILDANGQPSAANLEDFKKEVLANPDFAGIIKGTKGSGGGAGDAPPGGGGTAKTFKQMSEAEKSLLARTNNPEFRRLAAADGVTIVG